MGSITVKIEHTVLPENTSRARELQWQMEFWKREYAKAGSQKEQAWKIYSEAVDDPCMSREEKEELYKMAAMFDAIADDTWRQLQQAKADYLQLFN